MRVFIDGMDFYIRKSIKNGPFVEPCLGVDMILKMTPTFDDDNCCLMTSQAVNHIKM